MSEKFPFDYESLGRGDHISLDELIRSAEAQGMGDGPETDRFRLFCLRIAEDLRMHLFHRGQGHVAVTVRKDGIYILPDGVEQLEYCRREKRKARRMFFRRHLEHCSVDGELLSPEERAKWLREIERDSKLLAFDQPHKKLPEVGRKPLPG